MMKCWKAMVRLVGGGGCHLSREQRKGPGNGIGKTSEGVASSGVLAEQSMTLESLSGQVVISAWDNDRLHPGAWRRWCLAIASVPSRRCGTVSGPCHRR
jgi:hypothetical protein